MEVYCSICQAKRNMTASKQVTIKGKPTIQGTCPVCGTAVSRFPSLTSKEIADIKDELYIPPSREDRLQRVQNEIVRIFKNWAREEGRKYIRFICPREGVKPFNSIIDKINSLRSRFKYARGLDDLDDLIGAKILCPYITDVKIVIKWLFDSDQCFTVTPTEKEAQDKKNKMEKETGYRAYHFYLQLKKDHVSRLKLPKGSENEKFEVQIKTLLEEAWDAKTHDISYKPIRPVKPVLKEHMKLVSRALEVLDEQTELLKNEILEEEREERQRSDITKLVFLTALVPKKEREKLGFPKDKPVEQLKEKDIQKIKEKIKEISKSGISRLICYAFTLLALVTGSRDIEETALTCANKLVEQSEQNTDLFAISLSNKALILWALGYIPEAVEAISKAINYRNKILHYKGDYLFYVCELSDPTLEQKRRAKDYADEIEQQINAKPSVVLPMTKDSLGYFKIKFGEDQEAIESGRKYVYQMYEEIKSNPNYARWAMVSNAFYEMHNVRALKRLLDLKRKLPYSY